MTAPERDQPQQQVAALRHGTVVDHLNPGMALKAVEALGTARLGAQGAALLGMHLASGKLGHKDILKLENVELTDAEVAMLAIFGPQATVSWIHDFHVVRKVQVELPAVIVGTLRCPNPNCITNHEKIASRFDVETRRPIQVRCRYCERRISEREFILS